MEEAVDLEHSLPLLLRIQWRPQLTGERLRGLTVLSYRLRRLGEAERDIDLERPREDRRQQYESEGDRDRDRARDHSRRFPRCTACSRRLFGISFRPALQLLVTRRKYEKL